MPTIDYALLVNFLEDHYSYFVDYCDSEKEADEIINELRRAGGMETNG